MIARFAHRAVHSGTARSMLAPAVIAAVASAGLTAPALAGGRIHVDASLPAGSGDGSSWASAFGGSSGLQAALAAAASGNEIWVADGVYLPTTGTSRTISFVMKSGVAVYGGFASGETALAQRDIAANPAILSGDLLGDDGSGPGNDNSFHVVSASGGTITPASRFDGFTIRGGNANGGGDPNDRGGGLLIQNGADPTFANCLVEGNRCSFGGGAGYVRNASPTFIACTFLGNVGGNFGGAFDLFSSGGAQAVRFEGCRVIGNQAARAGGLEAFGNLDLTVVNSLVAGNTATGQGGGIWVGNGASADVVQSTVAENVAGTTEGVHLSGGSLTADNSIFYNPAGPEISSTAAVLRNCLVEGGWAGGGSGNIDGDPMLIGAAGGSAMIAAGSAAADAGNNTLVPLGLTVDVDGEARFVDDPCAIDTGTPGGAGGATLVDIGASERATGGLDCNTNGIDDDCEIADGSAGDCNGNGIPDACDIAAGAEDCNANGRPDTCEVASDVVADSGVLGPFGTGSPQSLTLDFGGEAASDVVIDLAAVADLDLGFEVVAVDLAGTSFGNLFVTAGNCSDPPSLDQLVLTAAEWNAIVTPGVPATLTLTPNGAVDPGECPGGSSVQIVVSLTVAGDNDADLDGVPDDCGDVCDGDTDMDGVVGLSDLLSVLAVWGPCPAPCAPDFDGNGIVGIGDLLTVLANWGPCD